MGPVNQGCYRLKGICAKKEEGAPERNRGMGLSKLSRLGSGGSRAGWQIIFSGEMGEPRD
jgi:hypothetical protein